MTRVKKFLLVAQGLFLRDTTGDRVTPVKNPYQDPDGGEIKTVKGISAVEDGYLIETRESGGTGKGTGRESSGRE